MSDMTEEEKKTKHGERCPVCYTEWTKTPRIVCNEYWWHCVRCEKKAEDIKSSKTNPIDSKTLDSLWSANKGWI